VFIPCREKGGEAERMQFVIVLDIDTWELWKQVRVGQGE
jgi:hypothetical protein